MTIKSLLRIIVDSYPFDIVDFANVYPDGAYRIRQNNGQWEVYYCEKRQKIGLKRFDSESDACKYLLQEIKTACNKD